MGRTLIIRREAVRNDPALEPGARGARKLLVTELYGEKEAIATETEWQPPGAHQKCPVLVTRGTEIAVFNHEAEQDRHFHRKGTEIYMVVEGRMTIEVEGENHQMIEGDMIIVPPGASHQVKKDREFLCSVVTIDCGGAEDKIVL